MEQKALPVKIEFEGLRVMGVGQNTTAAALGLIGGDALVSVAGKMSTSAAAIDDALRGVKAGETVRAHWIRKGALMYADAKAEILGPTGELNNRVVLGAALGPKVRESVSELVERARTGESVEEALEAGLWEHCPTELREEIATAVDAQLEGYRERMRPELWERTVERNRLRSLRQRLGLPSLKRFT